jgi:hypothetical protein
MQKAPYVVPLVGGRKVEQLYDNIRALSIARTPKQIKYLESEVSFDPGFPHTVILDGFLIIPSVKLFPTPHRCRKRGWLGRWKDEPFLAYAGGGFVYGIHRRSVSTELELNRSFFLSNSSRHRRFALV